MTLVDTNLPKLYFTGSFYLLMHSFFIGDYVPPPPSAAEAMRRHRKMTMGQRGGGFHSRGGASYYGSDTGGDGQGNDVAFDFESLKVVGTCQKLEKDYFRLTSAPPPNTVRPENILRQALELVKGKWERDEVEYIYMCSQFKSIRQDLTVQHIQNGAVPTLTLI